MDILITIMGLILCFFNALFLWKIRQGSFQPTGFLSQVEALNETLAKQERETQGLKTELAAKENQMQKLNSELSRVTSGLKDYEERMKKLERSPADIEALERSFEEEKRAAHEMKLRLQENQIKLKLLNDKTKDTVEAVAQFAQGKEFDEFRKSLHTEEIVQKYEKQIKELRVENLELQKKINKISDK